MIFNRAYLCDAHEKILHELEVCEQTIIVPFLNSIETLLLT